MHKLTQKQQSLLSLVQRNPGANTHQLAELRGDRQAYESSLRDRLFSLKRRGLVTYQNITSKRFNSCVIQRKWYATEQKEGN